MNDQTSATPATPATTPPIQMNDEAARSPTGEIIDQSTAPPPPSSTTTPPTTPATTDGTSPPTKTGEPPKPEAKPPATTGAPEAYTDFTLPDGVTVTPETLTEAHGLFKKYGLSQEAAQELVSFQAKQMQSLTKDPIEAIKAQEKTWSAATLADPDISAYALDGKTGIDAVKLDIGRAKSVLSPTERAAFDHVMNWTGIGSNPDFVRALWRMGQHITEGRPVSTANAQPSPHGQRAPGANERPTPARSLYPNLG